MINSFTFMRKLKSFPTSPTSFQRNWGHVYFGIRKAALFLLLFPYRIVKGDFFFFLLWLHDAITSYKPYMESKMGVISVLKYGVNTLLAPKQTK